MAVTTDISEVEAVGMRFLAALADRNWTTLESHFDERVQFRALVPSGLREAADSASAAKYLGRWFGDADELLLLAFNIEPMQDRLAISYRFRAHKDQWYVVEQRAYCDVIDGRITSMSLLCSGFHRESSPSPV